MEIINTVAQSVVIAGFLTGAFSYIVLTPLNKSIEGLRTIAKKRMSELNKAEQKAQAAGDQAKVDKINREQLKAARDALKLYKE